MKSELKLRWDGTRRFAERNVKHLEVPYTDAERLIHRTLQQYSELRSKSAATAGEQFATEFVLKLLKKRLFSSPAAFAITLRKHVAIRRPLQRLSGLWRLGATIEEADDEYADDEEYENTASKPLQTASEHSQRDIQRRKKAAAASCSEYATAAVDRPDSKAQR